MIKIYDGLHKLKMNSSVRWVVDQLLDILNIFPKDITWKPFAKQLERP